LAIAVEADGNALKVAAAERRALLVAGETLRTTALGVTLLQRRLSIGVQREIIVVGR
jgi:hypothetical protein